MDSVVKKEINFQQEAIDSKICICNKITNMVFVKQIMKFGIFYMEPASVVSAPLLTGLEQLRLDAGNEAHGYSVEQNIIRRIGEQLLDVKSQYFIDEKKKITYIFQPFLYAVDYLPHLSGEGLLYALISLHLLSQLNNRDNSLTNLIYGMCEIADHFFQQSRSLVYESLYGDIIWYVDVIKSLNCMEPLEDVFSLCSSYSLTLCEADANGTFTQCLDHGLKSVNKEHPCRLTDKPRNRFHDWYALSFWLKWNINADKRDSIVSELVEWQKESDATGSTLTMAIRALSLTYAQLGHNGFFQLFVEDGSPDGYTIEKWTRSDYYNEFVLKVLQACHDQEQFGIIYEALRYNEASALHQIEYLLSSALGRCNELKASSYTYDELYNAVKEFGLHQIPALRLLLARIKRPEYMEKAAEALKCATSEFFIETFFPPEFSLRVVLSPRVLEGGNIQNYIEDVVECIKKVASEYLVPTCQTHSLDQVLYARCISIFVREIIALAEGARKIQLFRVQRENRVASKNALFHLLASYYAKLVDPALKLSAFTEIMMLRNRRDECKITSWDKEMAAFKQGENVYITSKTSKSRLTVTYPQACSV